MEKFKVVLSGNEIGVLPDEDKLLEAAQEAGWSEDPGEGITVLIDDQRGAPGYEVFNPIPFAPPIGWEPTPPIDELIRQRVREEVERIENESEIDDIVDAEDFDIPDELPELSTIYEFVGMEDEGPRVPKDVEVSQADRIKDELDFEELKEKERRVRQRRAREEYERRRKEEEELYGPSEAVRDALKRAGEKGA